jgi:P-type Ca2+ transporter type 2C
VRAVEEGRVIFDNIVKFVRFQLSTNIGAILTVLAATLTGMPTPFTAIQLLWINIIMDGPPAMTLGVEPARPGIMRALPRRQDSQILTLKRSALLGLYGTTMMVGTLWLFQDALATHGEAYALTLAFTTFVLFQFFNVFNARSEHGSAFNVHFLANGKLWLALGAVLALQILVVNWPTAQEIFATTHLSAADWLKAALVASSVLLLDEGRKWAQQRFTIMRFRNSDERRSRDSLQTRRK